MQWIADTTGFAKLTSTDFEWVVGAHPRTQVWPQWQNLGPRMGPNHPPL